MTPDLRSRLHTLSDDDFRKELLNCHACFEGSSGRQHCRHHEDVIGGWRDGTRLTGRIVVVGLNPQGREDDPVYEQIERPENWRMRAELGDRVLDIYAGEDQPDAAWGWERDQHQGLKTWFPLVQRRLGVPDPTTLAKHFAFVELFKHTTANEAGLTSLLSKNKQLKVCPDWLFEQLTRLEPCLLIVTGNKGKERVARRLVTETIPDGGITRLHATSYRVAVGKAEVDMYLSVAFSRASNGAWKSVLSDPETAKRSEAMMVRVAKAIDRRARATAIT